jgi:hypothetical protein
MQILKSYNIWDIAFQHGHSAFKLLKTAKDIENKYHIIHKQQSLSERTSIEYLELIGNKDIITDNFFKTVSSSIILFQSMMEAVINSALLSSKLNKLTLKNFRKTHNEFKKKGNFYCKWIMALEYLEKDYSQFNEYHLHIYEKYRNPLVHPSSIEPISFDGITIENILNGYKNGWNSFKLLYEGIGRKHDKNSWEIMCSAYNLY